MFRFMPQVYFEGEGTGGAGGQQQSTGAPSAPPWGADVNTAWNIGDKPWYDHLPDGPVKAFYQEKKYANPVQAAEANYSAHKMVNGAAVEIPAEDAAPDKWNDFYKRLGRPEKPDEYKFEFGKDNTGKERAADEGMVKFARELAYENGFSPKRAQAMVDKWNKFIDERNTQYMRQQQEANQNDVLKVQQKWADKLDEFKAAGQRVVQSLGLEQADLQQIEGAIGAAPMLNLFAKLGSMAPEGTFKGGGSGGDPNNIDNMTPTAAKSEIERLRGDAEFQKQYTEKDHPQHEAAVERMSKLYAKANVVM